MNAENRPEANISHLVPESHELPSNINITFVGYRATGKSTISTEVASRLGRSRISTDDEIVRREGMEISEIVAQHDWDYFRDRETEVVKDVTAGEGLVIDTGGGAILREENRDALRKNSVIFRLQASIPTMARRISEGTKRPPLVNGKTAQEEVEEVMQVRGPIYDEMAQYTINTDKMGIEEAVDFAIKTYKNLTSSKQS